MAFNGSGLFVRLYNWVQDKANGINITASRMDAETDGIAAGLSNCVTRDGQGKMGTDFTPASDNAYDLGSASNRWRNINVSGGFPNPVSVNGLYTSSGVSVATASGTPVGLVTVGGAAGKQIIYLVSLGIPSSNDAANYNCTVLVSTNGSSAKLTVLQSATLMTASMSGLLLQGTQSSGASNTITWTLARLQ